MRIILLNKPFHCLSQFTDSQGRMTLSDCLPVSDVYAAGRLDYDSEGLLLLTDHGKLQSRITEPRYKLQKTYLAQVEGNPAQAQLEDLIAGVSVKGKRLAAVSARELREPETLWPRHPPIRERRHIPVTWIELVIEQGFNRQVRRMTAAAGLPTLRLVRTRIGPWSLGQLMPGEWRELSAAEIRAELGRLRWKI